MSRIVFDFLTFCLTSDKSVPKGIETVEWEKMYQFARQQAIVGVMFNGVLKLKDKGVDIPRPIFLKWLSQAEKIKKRNAVMNQKCVDIAAHLVNDGLSCCILKGQGNAVLYNTPLLRSPGDIDVWIDADRDAIIDNVRRRYEIEEIRIYHIGYHVDDVSVEAHFVPGIMNNPFYNRRLQKFYAFERDKQCRNYVDLPGGVGCVPVPTLDFNLIYQMAHLMHHFFDEGIGLRQMIDYFFLLKEAKRNDLDNEWVVSKLKYLNLYKFAGAVMFVLQRVLGLEDDFLIVPTDKRRGRTLGREIFKGGNFGKYSGLTRHGAGTKYFLKHWRNLHFVREYPVEALSEPIFRTYHFFWRLRYN
jgi:hypothetical protein